MSILSNSKCIEILSQKLYIRVHKYNKISHIFKIHKFLFIILLDKIYNYKSQSRKYYNIISFTITHFICKKKLHFLYIYKKI